MGRPALTVSGSDSGLRGFTKLGSSRADGVSKPRDFETPGGCLEMGPASCLEMGCLETARLPRRGNGMVLAPRNGRIGCPEIWGGERRRRLARGTLGFGVSKLAHRFSRPWEGGKGVRPREGNGWFRCLGVGSSRADRPPRFQRAPARQSPGFVTQGSALDVACNAFTRLGRCCDSCATTPSPSKGVANRSAVSERLTQTTSSRKGGANRAWAESS